MNDLEWPMLFILCDLVWKVQKRHAVNRELSFKMCLPLELTLVISIRVCSRHIHKSNNVSKDDYELFLIKHKTITHNISRISRHVWYKHWNVFFIFKTVISYLKKVHHLLFLWASWDGLQMYYFLFIMIMFREDGEIYLLEVLFFNTSNTSKLN